MLTPKFDLDQDSSFILLTLHVPHIKISETEMYIDGTEFKFYVKPYYLRLNFSQEIVEDGREHARYDVEKGDITIKIPKKCDGEHFEDLDMISKLLAPKSKVDSPPSIEVVDALPDSKEDIPEDFTWEWDQEYPVDDAAILDVHYGFCNRYSDYYGRLVNEFPELLDLPDPDHTPSTSRRALLEDNLLHSFDMEHYLSDFMDLNEFVEDVLHYQPRYITHADTFTLVENQQDLLRQLPKQLISVERENYRSSLIGLVDILFSFVFDHLINCGEISVESCWNVCKISSQLSWLYTPKTLRECLILNFSNALTFPLYRHFDFCARVLQDIKLIISGGRSQILKCLISLHTMFKKHEFYYLHNKTYITDYCLWIQSIKDKHIEKLAAALHNLPEITKADVPFPLVDFEILVEAEETLSTSEEEEEDSEYETDSEVSNISEEERSSSTDPVSRKVNLPKFEATFDVKQTAEIKSSNEKENLAEAKENLADEKENLAEAKLATDLSIDLKGMSLNEASCKPLIEEIE